MISFVKCWIVLVILPTVLSTGTINDTNAEKSECIAYLQQQGLLPAFNISKNQSIAINSSISISLLVHQTTSIVIPVTTTIVNPVGTTSGPIGTTKTLVQTTAVPVGTSVISTVKTAIHAGTTTVSEVTTAISAPTTSIVIASEIASNSASISAQLSPSNKATINTTEIKVSTSNYQQTIPLTANIPDVLTTKLSSSLNVQTSATPSVSVNITNSVVLKKKSKVEICKQVLFGNWTGNGSLPFWLLEAYGATPPPTTKAPTTTEPIPTNTTTLSPSEIYKRFCSSYHNNSFEDLACTNPCDKCTFNLLNHTNEYLKCQLKFNDKQAQLLEDEPMLLTLLMERLGAQINKYQLDRHCPRLPSYFIFDRMLWLTGRKFRYDSMRLPDYEHPIFKPGNNRYRGRNGSIQIPYGNIPRSWYTYEFALYEKIIDKKIPKSKLRLKHSWPYKHPIITGAYIDPRSEGGLYVNNKLELNSAIISLELSPARENPLPGENIIALTHLRSGMENPVCVYWQPLKAGQPGALPTIGYWSNYGVRVFKTNASMTECRSYHLSTFAVLMQPVSDRSEVAVDPLDAMIVILTIISILMLVIYVVAMFLLKCVQYAHSRMYICIALSCLMGQIFFIIGFYSRNSWSTCTTMATWMQFCHTSVVTWLMLEGVHHLSKLQSFFNEKTNTDAFYFLLGCGFPVAVEISLQEFPYQYFNELRFCWLYISAADFMFFGAPLIAIVLVTLALRFITFLELRKSPEKIEKDVNYSRAKNSLIACIVVLPTYALLWGFGTYAIRANETTQGAAMIIIPVFYIGISFEILYLYFYRNDEVIDAVLEELTIREKNKLKTYAYLKGLNMKVSYEEGTDDSGENSDDDWDNEIKIKDERDNGFQYSSV